MPEYRAQAFDGPFWEHIRDAAIACHECPSETLVEAVYETPNLLVYFHNLHAMAGHYAGFLRAWAETMDGFRAKMEAVHTEVKQIMPGIGYGPLADPRLTEPGSGSA